MDVKSFFFRIFASDSRSLTSMCNVGRVRYRNAKTAHAAPSEAIMPQQGVRWVGSYESYDILKRRLQASCL